MSGKTAVYIVLGTAATALAVIVQPLPLARRLQRSGEELVELRAELERQETLAPLHSKLTTALRDAESMHLPVPRRAPLSYEKLPELPDRFRELARECALRLVEAKPVAQELRGDRDRILVSVLVEGEFAAFRPFLLELVATPWMAGIDALRISRHPEIREMHVQAWIAVK